MSDPNRICFELWGRQDYIGTFFASTALPRVGDFLQVNGAQGSNTAVVYQVQNVVFQFETSPTNREADAPRLYVKEMK